MSHCNCERILTDFIGEDLPELIADAEETEEIFCVDEVIRETIEEFLTEEKSLTYCVEIVEGEEVLVFSCEHRGDALMKTTFCDLVRVVLRICD